MLVIALRVVAHFMDKSRIIDYLGRRGFEVESIVWTPFGPGWFGEKNARIYEETYYDKKGKVYVQSCKTSLFSGVYLTDDSL